jgi:amine acid ABC transporter, permease protein, 3-TM region, His/Glu/Gln/Arg/opine family
MKTIELFMRFWPSFTDALGFTLRLTVVSLFFATIIGIIFGMFKVSKSKMLKFVANVYIDIIRGTPLIVQAYVIYFGIPSTFSIQMSAFIAGSITLSVNAGAYMAELVRGGIEAVDKGQMEASRSLGLSYGKSMRKVVLPQALRTMLPSIINQFIITLKDTSILSVIGIRELTMNAKIIAANNVVVTMTIWLFAAVFYLVICTILSKLAKYLERRLSYE